MMNCITFLSPRNTDYCFKLRLIGYVNAFIMSQETLLAVPKSMKTLCLIDFCHVHWLIRYTVVYVRNYKGHRQNLLFGFKTS